MVVEALRAGRVHVGRFAPAVTMPRHSWVCTYLLDSNTTNFTYNHCVFIFVLCEMAVYYTRSFDLDTLFKVALVSLRAVLD